MDDWQTLIVDSLDRIESKLDTKVNNDYCRLMHSKAKSVQLWLSIIMSGCALIGIIYTASSFVDNRPEQDKVVMTDGK